MRGKVFSQHRKYNSNRITPAYAGKSHFRKIFFRPFRDHPRLCGEKKLDREEAKDLGGITPAYAGKSRLAGADFCRVMWITPAYAGKR